MGIAYAKTTTTISESLYDCAKKLKESDLRNTCGVYILMAATIEAFKNELFLYMKYDWYKDKLTFDEWLKLCIYTEKADIENNKNKDTKKDKDKNDFEKELENFNDEQRRKCEEYSKQYSNKKMGSVLVIILNILVENKFSGSEDIFEQINFLFVLRNEMVHFKFSPLSNKLKKEEKLLNKYIKEKEIEEDNEPSSYGYPDKLFTKKGAEWAYNLLSILSKVILDKGLKKIKFDDRLENRLKNFLMEEG